ncbi:tetratricopeptide repeat protein [Bradyrhizobium sp. Leo170]|uniref:tetratricopeptide repeat protein n=1 Tax=Bradyrhizobium sp. Leo170 TaxID=1571199 RepID=UPI00102EA950|nr:tetratricopeptide repeat protein [Bradyrhizobium sp. Leo170]TAI61189.1 hypothetical protein CWO89_36545 [Bradyrhizobium sp. Leo170]
MLKAASGEALALGASMLKHASAERRMEFIQTVMNRGLDLYQSGQFDSAEVLFETVASEPTARPRVQLIRGVIALQRGEDERALDLLEESIQLNPVDSEAHANLGLLLLKVRQHPQALAAYAAALTLQPNNIAALFGLARALTTLDLMDFAHDAFRDTLACAPDYADPAVDFAVLLNDMGRRDEAVVLLQDALARHPEHAKLHVMLFICLFVRGDWRAAWPHNEWRLKEPEVSKHLLPTDRPCWQGEDLAGKTILLQSEQGFGDTIQFVRYAPMIKARGGRVILRVQGPLLPLMRTVDGIDDVFDTEEEAAAFDVHVPLMSLPLIFGTQSDAVPATVPYITPDPDLVARWRERLNDSLGAHSGLSVGLVWQGNPAHPYDWRRSLRLDRLRPLFDCPGTRFVSLQVGPGQNQLTEFDIGIVNAGAQIDATSFADAAAIIANLDLVISIDSAIAHLAGAMGKPVWILLAKGSDWRWLRDRDDTPWYPQARLFRQAEAGDWGDVVERVRAEMWSTAGAAVPLSQERIALPRASDAVLCDALFVEGCRQQKVGNLGRAKKLFEHVLSLDPEHGNTLCNLGALELGSGDGELALRRLQVAVRLAPDLALARTLLADALMAAQKTEQSLAQYRKAIELAPTNADAHAAYASALRKLGDGEQADMHADTARRLIHEHYSKALELAPNDDALHAAYALALCELGDIDNAMMHFLAATKINQQQSAEFYEALGRACAARGNSQGAEISLKHALALDPQRVTAHCALGDLYCVLDRPDDAETSFRGALSIDAGSAVALRGIERVQTSHRTMAINGMS